MFTLAGMPRVVAQWIAGTPPQWQLGRANHAKLVICYHAIDITYVPMRHGFMYLVAVIDWFSRYVLTWQLSNTLDGYFCLDALQQALRAGQPEIFNTDRAPVRAFIFSGGNPPFPVEVGTAQHLTQRSKDQWGQSEMW